MLPPVLAIFLSSGVFGAVPGFYPGQQPNIPAPDLRQHFFYNLYPLFPYQPQPSIKISAAPALRAKPIVLQNPPVIPVALQKPVEVPQEPVVDLAVPQQPKDKTSVEEVKQTLETLIKQQDETSVILKRMEKTFQFTTKASMELQAKEAWAQKAKITGGKSNFWTNRPDLVYVADVVEDADVVGSGDEADAVMALMALKDDSASSEETLPRKRLTRSASKATETKETTKRKGSSTKTDNLPKKKQRKNESKNTSPMVLRSKRSTTKK